MRCGADKDVVVVDYAHMAVRIDHITVDVVVNGVASDNGYVAPKLAMTLERHVAVLVAVCRIADAEYDRRRVGRQRMLRHFRRESKAPGRVDRLRLCRCATELRRSGRGGEGHDDRRCDGDMTHARREPDERFC